MLSPREFRFDINGLRAYAVILVVLYHFEVLGFKAGFIGVDIFFVISGYLMTKIIVSQLIQDRFSILKFYLSRGIRILPALLTVVTLTGVLGWFLIIPEMYKLYGKYAAASLTFLSNFTYLREATDYFAPSSHDNALLHTWSLSVEWQFYILLPIVLILITKIKKSQNAINILLVIAFILSLLLSYKISQSNTSAAFFMIPTRAWEMIAGGLVFVYANKLAISNNAKKGIELFGFALILISLIWFDSKTLWPSIYALLPVIGSALILIANRQDSIFTKPKIFQLVGDASYSIYLWHWPIVFFITYLGYQTDNFIIILGIIVSLILGWLSYKYIENTSRKYLTSLNIKNGYIVLVSITAVFSLAFALIFIKNGLPQRASQKYLTSTNGMEMPLPSNGWCFNSVDTIASLKIGQSNVECRVGTSQNIKHKALLFGDSFAGHNIPFWDEVGRQLDTQVQVVSTNWCYPALSDDFPSLRTNRSFEQCIYNRKFLANNMQNYDYLIFSGLWKTVDERKQWSNVKHLLDKTQKLNIRVIIMASPYTYSFQVTDKYKRATWLGKDFQLINDEKFDSGAAQANEALKKLASSYPNVIFLDRENLFPQNNLTADGRPYSLDGAHISILGSKASATHFEKSAKFQQLKENFR